MANTIREKELKTKWPFEEGLTAGTTKQRKTSTYLIPEEKSNIKENEGIGIDGY